MGGPDRLVAEGAHLAVEGKVDVAIREEGQGPAAQARGEAKVHEDGRKAILMHVVEEALNVKHEGGAVEAAAVGDVDIVAAGPKASPKHVIITNRCIYDKYESRLYHYVK